MSTFQDNSRLSELSEAETFPVKIATTKEASAPTFFAGKHRRSVGSWTASLLTHSIVLIVAAYSTAPQLDWQTEVTRGEAAVVTLIKPAAESPQRAALMGVEFLPIKEPLLAPPEPEFVRHARHELAAMPKTPDGEPIPVSHIAEQRPRRAEESDAPSSEDQQHAKPLPKQEASAMTQPQVAAIPTTAGARVQTPPVKLPENMPPAYPDAARNARHEGRVRLAVVVDTEGGVASVAVEESSGFASLDQAAVDSVSRWRFTPATEDDSAVKAEILVPIRFSLRAN